MKKGISISLVLLMITAILNFSVASHYCSGKLAASKVSLSGKLANCGMEGSEEQVPLPGTYFSNHCCEDVVAFLGISSNYTPSFSFIPDPFKNNFQIIGIPLGYDVHSTDVLKSYSADVSPPPASMSTNVDLSDICVFRI